MYHIFFIHSSVDGHLCCFHVLALVNSVQRTLGCMYPFGSCFSPEICPRVGFQSHMVALVLVFKEPSYCSPRWLYQFTFPPTVQEGSLKKICFKLEQSHVGGSLRDSTPEEPAWAGWVWGRERERILWSGAIQGNSIASSGNIPDSPPPQLHQPWQDFCLEMSFQNLSDSFTQVIMTPVQVSGYLPRRHQLLHHLKG